MQIMTDAALLKRQKKEIEELRTKLQVQSLICELSLSWYLSNLMPYTEAWCILIAGVALWALGGGSSSPTKCFAEGKAVINVKVLYLSNF
jgi:hypothetical protein